MAMFNDFKAVKRGRIMQRIWNRLILKATRRLMK